MGIPEAGAMLYRPCERSSPARPEQRPITPGVATRGTQYRARRKIAPGASDFRRMRLIDVARACCKAAGLDVSRLPDQRVADIALAWKRSAVCGVSYCRQRVPHHQQFSPAYCRTRSTRTLLTGWQEAPSTWRQWVRVAESVHDFKQIHRIMMGGVDSLEEVPEGRPFPQGTFVDGEEIYAVKTVGKSLQFLPARCS